MEKFGYRLGLFQRESLQTSSYPMSREIENSRTGKRNLEIRTSAENCIFFFFSPGNQKLVCKEGGVNNTDAERNGRNKE